MGNRLPRQISQTYPATCDMCGCATLVAQSRTPHKRCAECAYAVRRAAETARAARNRETLRKQAKARRDSVRCTTDAGRREAVEARRIASEAAIYAATGVCQSCFGLPHRRPLDGCPVCGGAYQAPPGRQMTDRLLQSAAGCIS